MAFRWIIGILLLAFGVLALVGGVLERRKDVGGPSTKKQSRSSRFGAIALTIIGILVIPHGSGKANNASTGNTVSSESNTTKPVSVNTDTTKLTPNDITDYDNGPGLQANNTFNAANNGISTLENDLNSGQITMDQFRTKVSIAESYVKQAYSMFKSEKTPAQLQSITNQYNDLINKKLLPLFTSYQMTSQSGLSDLDSQLQDINNQKAQIDSQYQNIKSDVMAHASKQAVSASSSKDSYLKQGPTKIANHGGLGDTYATITAIFGQPSRVNGAMNQGVGMYNFQNDNVEVDFVESRADHLTYSMDSAPISFSAAQSLAHQMMPPDAQFVKKYTDSLGQLTYVYKSSMLSKLFDQSWFANTDGVIQPGYFDIAYTEDSGQVVGVDAFISDNP